MTRKRGIHTLACVVIVLTSAGPLLAQTKYVVNDLGTLGGPTASATGINNAGQVVGNSSLSTGETRGYRTASNRPINPATDAIGTLGGSFSLVSGINSSGQVSGTSANAAGSNRAIRVDVDGSVVDLGTLGGNFPSSNANAINDLGQLTGATSGPIPAFGPPCFGTGGLYAFRTAPNSAMVSTNNLGTLLGLCRYSVGFGINSSGQVVGYSAAVSVFNPEQHAVVASPGGAMVDLGLLGGSVTSPAIATGKHAQASAINAAGQVVGNSTYDNPPFYYATHAFLTTTAGGAMTDLGTLGGSFSAANAINAAGQIVGNTSLAGDTVGHAFLYANGAMSDLNSTIAPNSGWELVDATGINDGGQIIGTAWLNGVRFANHAVRLDPVDVAISNFIGELSDTTLGLTTGQINSLTDKLSNALASVQQGANRQAINQLTAFLNSVQSWQKTNKVSAQTAATLTSAANAIIAVL